MYTLKETRAQQDKVVEIAGSKELFEERMVFLKEKWDIQDDTVETRLMRPFFDQSLNLSPFFISIISDNPIVFKKHYNKDELNAKELIKITALCGAEKITETLLAELKSNYLSAENEYLLSYTAASGNMEWTKRVAATMAEAGKPMPKDVYLLGNDFDSIEEIVNIFKSSPKNTIINKKN